MIDREDHESGATPSRERAEDLAPAANGADGVNTADDADSAVNGPGSVAESDWDGGLRAAFGGGGMEGPPSVLERIEERFGRISRVFLSDAHEGDRGHDDGPILNAATSAALKGDGRYQTLGEIARGGVGVVLQGHDANLGRDVAVKVLRSRHQNNPELVQRFVEEAQIGGQLQHPGIVPVYDLGVDGSRRPFFTMKLVRGRTLAALMADYETPAAGRGRLLGIFETICQTMAYAHSRGVIHRDLKPANVMVGAFGEVQVMDWGFAKVLSRGGVEDERKSIARGRPEEVATVRSGPEGTQSFAGSVYGTPAYMPPEQANGGVDTLDERADVFALGAILCEILTGKPPYVPGPEGDVLADAAAARLDGAMERLDRCSADADLIDLAKQCLAASPEGRPRNARAVSKVIAAQIASTEARAAEARVEAAEARVRAAQERTAKRLSVALAVAVCTLVVAAGAGWYWIDRAARQVAQRTERDVDAALRDVESAMEAKQWNNAKASLAQAKRSLEAGTPPDALRGRVAAVDTAFEQRLVAAELEERLGVIRLMPDTPTDAVDAAYRQVFEQIGWDPATGSPPPDLAERVHEALRFSTAMALDDWAIRRLGRNEDGDEPAAIASPKQATIDDLVEAAVVLDPDPWRRTLRRAAATVDAAKLLALADGAGTKSAASIDLLAVALAAAGEPDRAIHVLEQGYRAHPNAFWINVHLSRLYRDDENTDEQALIHGMIALSLQPRSAAASLEMARIYAERGEDTKADDYLAQARALDQQGEKAWDGIMKTARRKGHGNIVDRLIENLSQSLPPHRRRARTSLRAARREVSRNPSSPIAHLKYGESLMMASDFTGAIAAFEKALSINGELASARVGLADALREVAQYDRARSEIERALELDMPARRARRIRDRIEEDSDLARRIREGEEIPASIATARIHRQARRYASASRDYVAVLAGVTDVWDFDVQAVTFEAVCCAVLASAGRGSEAAKLSPPERQAWRDQARRWMQARVDRLPANMRKALRPRYALQFANWFLDTRLDPVRPTSLDDSAPDAAAWRDLWKRVESVASGR